MSDDWWVNVTLSVPITIYNIILYNDEVIYN